MSLTDTRPATSACAETATSTPLDTSRQLPDGHFDNFNSVTSALAEHGWCVVPNFLSMAQTQALATECADLHQAQLLTPARVGAGRVASTLRGDSTRWFQPEALSAPQQAFAERVDALRMALNRDLFLGLVDSESHYAVYRPGMAYARHLDRLRNTDARVVSAVCYLNETWQEVHGGALRLYLPDGSHHDVFPHGGTLALFLSGEFEHEVLPATRERMSIACWMRQRT